MLMRLASVYMEQKKYADAEPLLKRAMSISEQIYGPIHPSIAELAKQYAFVLRQLERVSEAELWEARAQSITAATAP
jgi:hypothetical protein